MNIIWFAITPCRPPIYFAHVDLVFGMNKKQDLVHKKQNLHSKVDLGLHMYGLTANKVIQSHFFF